MFVYGFVCDCVCLCEVVIVLVCVCVRCVLYALRECDCVLCDCVFA